MPIYAGCGSVHVAGPLSTMTLPATVADPDSDVGEQEQREPEGRARATVRRGRRPADGRRRSQAFRSLARSRRAGGVGSRSAGGAGRTSPSRHTARPVRQARRRSAEGGWASRPRRARCRWPPVGPRSSATPRPTSARPRSMPGGDDRRSRPGDDRLLAEQRDVGRVDQRRELSPSSDTSSSGHERSDRLAPDGGHQLRRDRQRGRGASAPHRDAGVLQGSLEVA